MLDEEGKAVQEVAKATGKAIDASREMGGFIAKYIDGPLEQAMGIWEDKLKYHRWENQIRLMQRATKFLQDRGLPAPTRPVPLSLAIPLLEEATLPDDDELRDRWGMLLANAADAKAPEVRRAYVSILAEMIPLDTLILDVLFDSDATTPHPPSGDPLAFGTARLPGAALAPVGPEYIRLAPEDETNWPARLNPDVETSLVNLVRLGLIDSAAAFGGAANMWWVSMTELGRQFVIACRPPRTVGTTD